MALYTPLVHDARLGNVVQHVGFFRPVLLPGEEECFAAEGISVLM
jgi:hypothetical protein